MTSCQICQKREPTGCLRYGLYLCQECTAIQRARRHNISTAFNRNDPPKRTYTVHAVSWTYYVKRANKKKPSGWYKKVYTFDEEAVSALRLADNDGSYVGRILPRDVPDPARPMGDIPLKDFQPPLSHWEIREKGSDTWELRGTLVGVPFEASSRGMARHG